MLRTLVIDFNSFFASVEQQLRPELRGRPVGVVPMITDSTCLIAASYECKRRGVKTLTRVGEAKRIIPEIVLVQARAAEYVRFHERAIAVIDQFLPLERVMSIDEMSCEVPRRFSSPDIARAKAQQIKDAVRAELGTCLTTSVGIAPNVFLAKQASNMQKPDGLTIIKMGDLPQAMYALELADLTGIGRSMLARLHAFNVYTVEQLYLLNKNQMRVVWGGVAGVDFYERLRGTQLNETVEGGKSISQSHVLPPDMRTLPLSYAVLDRLTQKAAMRLRRMHSVTQHMQIIVNAADHYRDRASRVQFASDANFSQTQDVQALVRHLSQLWQRILVQAQHYQTAKPYQVVVVLGKLMLVSQQTRDLFEVADELERRKRPTQRLNQAIDALNTRFGKHTVYFGAAHSAPEQGRMAIAFNHIPDC